MSKISNNNPFYIKITFMNSSDRKCLSFIFWVSMKNHDLRSVVPKLFSSALCLKTSSEMSHCEVKLPQKIPRDRSLRVYPENPFDLKFLKIGSESVIVSSFIRNNPNLQVCRPTSCPFHSSEYQGSLCNNL